MRWVRWGEVGCWGKKVLVTTLLHGNARITYAYVTAKRSLAGHKQRNCVC